MVKIGDKYLITTDNWFFAPDGESYKAVFGTVHGIEDSITSLGIKTNAKSTNWYVNIGNMSIAGCQIHYVIKSDDVDYSPGNAELEYEGKRVVSQNPITRIYNADQ